MEQTKIKTLFKLSENEKAELKKKYFPVKTSVCYFNSGVVLLKSDGTVSYSGNDETIKSKLNGWNDITQICSGRNHVVGLKSNGTVIAVGDNTYSQCNVENWCYVKEIKSGDYNTIGVTVEDKIIFTGIYDDSSLVFQKLNDKKISKLGEIWEREIKYTREIIKTLLEKFSVMEKELDEVKAELKKYRADSAVVTPEQKVQQTVANPVSEFEYEVDNDEVTIRKYIGKSENIVIPSEIDGKKVVHIGDGVFKNCSNIKSIKIPSGITSIGNDAFSKCESLINIAIPSSVTSIGNGAFWCCKNLTNIEIPSGVTSIGYYAFVSCVHLTNIEISPNITSIGDFAFWNCINIISIEIPSGVTNMGESVFDYWLPSQTIHIKSRKSTSSWNRKWKKNCKAKIVWD